MGVIGFRNEKHFTDCLVRVARDLGFLAYHTHDSRRSAPGFPDAIIVGKSRIWALELKMPKGVVSEHQREWIAELQAAGIDARIIYPDDYETILEELQDAYEAAFRKRSEAA